MIYAVYSELCAALSLLYSDGKNYEIEYQNDKKER